MNNSKKRLRADLVLILALLCLAGGGFAYLHAQRTEGGAAVVYVDGVCTAEYPLARDCTVTLTGWDGGWNQLVIQDGKAPGHRRRLPGRAVHPDARHLL